MLQLFKKSHKAFTLLIAFTFVLTVVNAQLARLSQRPVAIGRGGWLQNDFTICGAENRDFRIEYNFCHLTPDTKCQIASACGSNPYKIHYRLLRNGHQVAKNTYQFSQAWGNWALYNFPTEPGVYQVEIRLELKSGIWPFCSWGTHQTTMSNKIIVTRRQSQPNFNINNVPIPNDGSPIKVCGSNIRVNAAATTCETRYLVSIQECDRWWTRTGDYEVDVWIGGQAPNNINLQQLAINNSQGETFSGSPNRLNTGLFGGNLPNGQKRYYRVSICVNEPSWVCRTALIEVEGNCRSTTLDADTNIYDIIGSGSEGLDMANLEYDAIIKGIGDAYNNDMEVTPCTNELVDGPLANDPLDPDQSRQMASKPTSAATQKDMPKLSPNPTNGQVNMLLNLKQESMVQVNIFNAAGNRVKQALSNKKLMPGQQSLPLDISNLKSGIYIVEVLQDKQVSKQKLVINQ